MRRTLSVYFCAVIFLISPDLYGQIAIIRDPQPSPSKPTFRISSVDINTDIQDQVATVQIAQTFHNVSQRTVETQFLFPLPHGAAVTELTLVVDGKELTGELKQKDEARRVYEDIVRRQKDPALLEYMGCELFRTSVFPVPAGGERRVEIRYTQLLTSDHGLIDFSLPLGTAKYSQQAIEKVAVAVRIKSDKDIRNIYSPTHDFEIERTGDNRATCRLNLKNVQAPDDVRLLYGTRGSDVGMNLVTYRSDSDSQGYFLLLATPRVKQKKESAVPKTVVFVVDHSGSMAGEKMDQAKASLVYMINALGPEDTFNIISYSSEVELFRPEPELVSDRTRQQALQYIEDIYAGGGTNINDALTTAVSRLQDRKRPNYVMFLTDGLPTVGTTDEKEIAANVQQANSIHARVFSFGVGYDVNSRLLDRVTRDHRGASVYVKPEEDIEVAATNLFRKVSSPAMTNLKIVFSDGDHKLVNRLYPDQLPDLFHGEQLMLVGRYKRPASVTVKMTGTVGDHKRTMKLKTAFGDVDSTRQNSFVETLWATRRIGQIIDDLDLNGHNEELVQELISLSLNHGIMTPYTSFLAEEEVSLGDRTELMTETRQRTRDGLSAASGYGGFIQREFKQSLQQAQRGTAGSYRFESTADSFRRLSRSGSRNNLSDKSSLGADNASEALGLQAVNQPVSESTPQSHAPQQRIRRIASKTFYWKNDEWQDSAIAGLSEPPKDADIITITQFTKAYFELTQQDNGRWAKFLTLAEPALLRIKGQTYRIVPPASTKSPSD